MQYKNSFFEKSNKTVEEMIGSYNQTGNELRKTQRSHRKFWFKGFGLSAKTGQADLSNHLEVPCFQGMVLSVWEKLEGERATGMNLTLAGMSIRR